MLSSREHLLEIAALADGELEETPCAALLLAHAFAESTRVLELRRGQVQKRIVLLEGVPVDCRSNLLHETIGRFMVQQGKLTEEAYARCYQRSLEKGVRIGEVLIAERLVDASELYRLLQQSLAKKLLDLFTWTQGEFRVTGEPATSDSTLKVKVPQLVVTGVTRFASQELIDRWTGPLVGKRLVRHPQPLFAIEEVRLTPQQSRLYEALSQPQPIEELAGDLAPEELSRQLCALVMLGVVVAEDQVPATVVAPSPAATPTPAAAGAPAPAAASATAPLPSTGAVLAAVPAPAVPAPSAASLSTVRAASRPPASSVAADLASGGGPADALKVGNEVYQAYLAFQRQDAFDLLGVPEDAPLAFIQFQYFDFARRFAPWRFSGPTLGSLAEKARDLFLAGANAYAELADNARRGALVYRRKTLREEAERKSREPYFQIKTDLLDPETQYKKGVALRDSGKLKAALQQFEFAADCDPQNAFYRAEAAYTRFLESPSLAVKVLPELREAMRIDPQCGVAALYAGEVTGGLGDRAQAEVLLRKAGKLLPGDRRPVEALKRLSAEKKK